MRGVGALILEREEYKMEYKSMDAMIVNTDGGMKKELQNIMTFGMILYFTNRRYEKYAVRQAKTKKAFTNILRNIWYLKKTIIVPGQYIW